ncbi:MAG: type II toxin-antitoxin system VapB family antitoxin [Parvularculaceae bacterium]
MSALNIKDRAVADMARKLAKLKGKSITEAVADALAASLDSETARSEAAVAARDREVQEILASYRAKRDPNTPTYEQIMDEMYDERGLPR